MSHIDTQMPPAPDWQFAPPDDDEPEIDYCDSCNSAPCRCDALYEASRERGGDVAGGHGAMKVLVACEFSGIVRDAFIAQGHDAISCDILPSEVPGPHIEGDIRDVDLGRFDLMVAHPPCTHLAVSGARWFKDKLPEQLEALDFVRFLMAAPIPFAIENPISIISSRIRKPDQIVQPWQFGHGVVKATCLWLHGLPRLQPTEIVSGRYPEVHRMSPGPNRWRERSRTYKGIAAAMADQWAVTA